MRIRFVSLALATAALGSTLAPAARAQAPDSMLARRAAQIGALLTPGVAPTVKLDTLFSPNFLAQVPQAQVVALFGQLAAQCGRVTAVERVPNPQMARFTLTCSGGVAVPIIVALGAAPALLVEGLNVLPPTRLAATLDDVVRDFKALHGRVTFLLARLDDAGTTTLAQLDSGSALGIGSAFKLYVLGELARAVNAKERALSDVVRLDSTRRSLPSGVLQSWPAGAPVTLHTLATEMVSISDNTAADELLLTLGRERVERTQSAMGNTHAERNAPFLSTRELFALKATGATALRGRFEGADAGARRAMLAEVDRAPLPSAAWGTPAAIDSIEWFASAADLVRGLRWLRDATASGPAAPIRGVLAVNPGIPLPREQWSYVGFKGGSEPGVLAMTFLLRAVDGRWYGFAVAWNDPARTVDQGVLLSIVQRAIELAPNAAPSAAPNAK